MESLAGVATKGVNSLWDISPLVTVLVLVVLALIYAVRALLIDAKEERSEYRKTLNENTRALNSLQEVIRVAIAFK